MRTLFDEHGIEYQEYGDYLIPNVSLPKANKIHIGVWAQRHKRYLKEHHRILYYNLLTTGELYDHLSDIEERAKMMYEDLIKALAQKEGITERLKADDPMRWIQMMNNIKNRATEIVNKEIIYTQ